MRAFLETNLMITAQLKISENYQTMRNLFHLTTAIQTTIVLQIIKSQTINFFNKTMFKLKMTSDKIFLISNNSVKTFLKK